MTLLTPAAYNQGGTYTALLDRQYLVTTTSQRDAATNHAARQGFYADRFPAYSNPSLMNWTVGPCAGVIQNTFASDAGDYRHANPSNVSGTFAASSPTLNRNDILGFQVKDNFYDSSGLNSVIPVVIQGTGSAGAPVDPTLPASFIPVLRAVINAASTTPVLQDLRARTVPSAAVLPVDTVAQRTALGSPHNGFTIWRTDNLVHEVADGAGAWRVTDLIMGSSNADLVTKVTTPYSGQLAFRTDLGRYARWNTTLALWQILSDGTCIARGNRVTTSSTTTSGTGIGVERLDAAVVNGRLYRVEVPLLHTNSSVTSDTIAGKITYTIDGSTPTASSPTLPGASVFINPIGPCPLSTPYPSTFTGTLKLLVCVGRFAGSGAASLYADGTRNLDVQVWDMGIDPGDTGVDQ